MWQLSGSTVVSKKSDGFASSLAKKHVGLGMSHVLKLPKNVDVTPTIQDEQW